MWKMLCAALALALAGLGWAYRSTAGDLEQARSQLAKAEGAAEALKRDRDHRQALLDGAAEDQGKKDAQAQAEIGRLAGELRDRPVRVRVIPATCGGAAPGAPAPAPGPGAADRGQADGVLDPAAAERLGRTLSEIEALNAAYASCRARLLDAASQLPP